MQMSRAFSNFSDDQNVYPEYRTSSSTFPFQQTQLPPTGFQWGRRSTQLGPRQSIQEVMPAGFQSEISDPSRIPPRVVNGSGSATSAQPPFQRINQRTHYSSSAHEAPFLNLDPFSASYPVHPSNMPRQDTNPQFRFSVGLTNQTRQIPQGDQSKVGSPRSFTAEPIVCKWEGCTYSGAFRQESSLIRHLRNFHFAPLSHNCPYDDCNKVCKRSDNLMQHIRNHHTSR